MTRFAAPIAEQIWDMKYRFKGFDGTPVDVTVEDTWNRIAGALAQAEKPEVREYWHHEFYKALEDFKFLPAGRIVSGAGTGRKVTLSNCFTMGAIPDDLGGIFDALKEAALTMQQGGGIGYDFSTLRPKGALVKGVAADASGPLTFMDVWDAMCKTIMSAGQRRGAMMATMICTHPDIEAFIEAKRDAARLRNFNLSVMVTDDFMRAVKSNSKWELGFQGKVYKTVESRDLWDKIMRSTYAYAEPGVIFIDRMNDDHNIGYLEKICTTNPCGEKGMGPYASCLLGSINLTRFVRRPFEQSATFDEDAIRVTVQTAIRMMDNVVDVGGFPLESQRQKAQEDRQLGLGVTGLADALLMLGLTYGSTKATEATEDVMRLIALSAYSASVDLAKKKGAFPTFNADEFLKAPRFAGRLPTGMKAAIRKHGIRNALLTSIAPTGTISLYAGNVSSGIEPVFAYHYTRKVLQPDGSKTEERVEDYALNLFYQLDQERRGAELPDYFVSAQTLDPAAHVRMQAAAQKWVDSSISKTINCPEDISFEDFKAVYELTYDLGCKGCTTYRPNDVTGSVLSVGKPAEKPVEAAPVSITTPDISPEAWAKAMSPTSEPAPVLANRADALHGQTYKLRWPGTDHALYVTINDDEQGHPYEVFLNTRNPEHYAWMMALTRMISAVFRRGGDTSFVAEELKAVFDPRGGAWVKGKYVPSMIAAIGDIIQNHVAKPRSGGVVAGPGTMPLMGEYPQQGEALLKVGKPCPKCSSYNTKNESGCFQCLDCGDSKCG